MAPTRASADCRGTVPCVGTVDDWLAAHRPHAVGILVGGLVLAAAGAAWLAVVDHRPHGWVASEAAGYVLAAGLVVGTLGGVGVLNSRGSGARRTVTRTVGAGTEPPVSLDFELPLARPGYDRSATEDLVRLAFRAAVEPDEGLRERVWATVLPVCRRGYDREAVDRLVRELGEAALDGRFARDGEG